MKIKKTAVAWFVLIASTITTAARTVAYYTVFDASVGYFPSGIISTLLYILPIALALPACVLIFRKKAELSIPALRTSPTLVSNGYCAVAMLAVLSVDVILAIRHAGTVYTLCALLALFGAITFLPLRRGTLTTLSGIAVVIHLLANVCLEYFDWNVTLNSPLKIYSQIALLAAALYLLAVIRTERKESTASAARLALFAIPAAVFSFSNGASGLASLPLGIHSISDTALTSFILSLFIGIHAMQSLYLCFCGTTPEEKNAE